VRAFTTHYTYLLLTMIVCHLCETGGWHLHFTHNISKPVFRPVDRRPMAASESTTRDTSPCRGSQENEKLIVHLSRRFHMCHTSLTARKLSFFIRQHYACIVSSSCDIRRASGATLTMVDPRGGLDCATQPQNIKPPTLRYRVRRHMPTRLLVHIVG
jgi:hypothetical protein